MALGQDEDFAGKLRLPMPGKFTGKPEDWEDWSWDFRTYLSMFLPDSTTIMDRIEANADTPIEDAHLNVAGNQDATDRRIQNSRRLHYLLANLCSDSARLVVRQNIGCNGYETWRRLYSKFALPDATRHMSLLSQILEFKFHSNTFEQDFNTWETIKARYESQTGQAIPDSILVATLLNKTTGPLQQHLRLNASALLTYEQTRNVIVQYHHSRHILRNMPGNDNQGPAPMDIGALKGFKGKGKGKGFKGFKGAKGPHWSYNKGAFSKGKGKGKDFKGKGKGKDPKGKGKDSKGKGKGSIATCWICGSRGHISRSCPQRAVSGVIEEDWNEEWSEEPWPDSSWPDGSWDIAGLSWDEGEDWSWDSSWGSWDSVNSWDHPWDWFQDSQIPEPPAGCDSAASSSAGPPPAGDSQQGTIGAVTQVPPGLSPNIGSTPIRPKAKPKASSFLIAALVMNSVTSGSSFQIPATRGSPSEGEGESWMTFGEHERLFESMYCLDTGLDSMPCLSAGLIAPVPGQDLLDWYDEPTPVKDSFHSMTTLKDCGLDHLNSKFVDTFLHEQLISAVEDSTPWILFDSGASAHCCPPDFGEQWPLLPLNGNGPPLKSVTGQPLNMYGRRLVGLNLDGQDCFMNFYVCDVPYPIVSVARLQLQGFRVALDGPDSLGLFMPNGKVVSIHRKGSLLFLGPNILPFDKPRFEEVCQEFHSKFGSDSSGTIAPTFKPTIYHNDSWELDPQRAVLIRHHKRARRALFTPGGTKDRPIPVEDVASRRTTYVRFEDGREETIADNWRTIDSPQRALDQYWMGRTEFPLQSLPTARRLTGKQSTIARPPIQEASVPAKKPHLKAQPSADIGQDDYSRSVKELTTGELEEAKEIVERRLCMSDPETGGPFGHDEWYLTPKFDIRIHHEWRNCLYVPDETDSAAPSKELLGNERHTLAVFLNGRLQWIHDHWADPEAAATEFPEPFKGATIFRRQSQQFLEESNPDIPEMSAQRPKGLYVPKQPTADEIREHELTHLPFRSWCEICVRSKSKQNQSRAISVRQPVIQVDYAFMGDSQSDTQVTLLTATDVLSGMGLACVVPSKGRIVYAQAELRKFVLEIGRTFGIVQCDPEASLKALVEAVTGDIGGLSYREAPTGWKQAQGSISNMQATLYAQIRALKLDIQHRYGMSVSVHSPLFPWIVKHSMWLLNRFLHRSDGFTPFERRWGKKYGGALCRIAESVQFRLPAPKSEPSWHSGIWLGRDTTSDQHFVADSNAVYKVRGIRRLQPGSQVKRDLMQGLRALPWDPKGSKVETDSFILPGDSAVLQKGEPQPPLGIPPTDEQTEEPDHDGTGEDSSAQLSQGLTRGHEDIDREPGEHSESPTNRRRLAEARGIKRTSEQAEIPEADSTVSYISAILPCEFGCTLVEDCRIATVTTRESLDLPIHVNQDEEELGNMKKFANPILWGESEFPRDLEESGMNKEMNSMKDFDSYVEEKTEDLTQEEVDSAISMKWVKSWKGAEVKCRLVARGFDQYIEDKDDTFASTPSLSTLKLLIALSIAMNLDVVIADVSTAFLHATLWQKIFVIPPKEYYPQGGVLWRLKKALYGLKGSPKAWQQHLAKTMLDAGFERLKSDPSLYRHKTKKLWALVYVDDLMFVGERRDIDEVMQDLKKVLLIRQTGELSEGKTVSFLGRQIRRTSDSMELFMSPDYIDRMLDSYGMTKSKPAQTPGGDSLRKLLDNELLNSQEHKLYRRLVGQLLWLAALRVDIMYAVKELSRGLVAPTEVHKIKLKTLLRYLSGTKDYVHVMRPDFRIGRQVKSLDIKVYVDSDWAGCTDSRRSTSGVALNILGINISAHSRTQATIALSSGEAELYAIGSGAAEALFIKSLILETLVAPKVNIILFTDSTAGKSMAVRFGASRKTKHVQLRFLFVQELVSSGTLVIKKIPGTLNPSDILTKYVAKAILQRHNITLGICPSGSR